MQDRVPNALDTACHLAFITEMSGPILYHPTIGEITITNIDIKFKTHFASTSSRAQNTQMHLQYSLFNFFSISHKNTKKNFLSSFTLIQHNMTIYYSVELQFKM
jgi:hypothetical protein